MQRAFLAGAVAAGGPIPVNGRPDSYPPRNHVWWDWMKERVGKGFRALEVHSRPLVRTWMNPALKDRTFSETRIGTHT